MAVKLNKAVPFGRSLDEYTHMFALTGDDLKGKILGVADGPASFNAELSEKGGRVISIDPLYTLTADEINSEFYRVVDDIIFQVKATPDDWVWSYHSSPDNLRKNRIRALKKFIADYPTGKISGRYINGGLPELPFKDRQFDLALCSHFLFLYSEYFSAEFHYASIREMLRVAGEVRIFPQLTLMLVKSPYLACVTEQLTRDGFEVSIREVAYELQRGGNEMLSVRPV